MQTTKKKPSLIFILVGAVLAGYLGYLINGAWTEGIAFNEFMDRYLKGLPIERAAVESKIWVLSVPITVECHQVPQRAELGGNIHTHAFISQRAELGEKIHSHTHTHFYICIYLCF